MMSLAGAPGRYIALEFSLLFVLFLKQTEERINYAGKYDESEEENVSIFIKLIFALGFDYVVCQNFLVPRTRFASIYCMNR